MFLKLSSLLLQCMPLTTLIRDFGSYIATMRELIHKYRQRGLLCIVLIVPLWPEISRILATYFTGTVSKSRMGYCLDSSEIIAPCVAPLS